MSFKKVMKILFIIVIIVLVYLIFEDDSTTYMSDTINDTEDNNVILENSIMFAVPFPLLVSNLNVLRQTNVPLTPFKSPMKIEYDIPIHETIPPFLVYKKEYLSPATDQGNCGSCWAFSICYMLSDRISINTGGKFNKTLSVQQLMSCFEPEDACYGNSPEEALMWLEKSQHKLNITDKYGYLQKNSIIVESVCPYGDEGINISYDSVKTITEWIEEEKYDEKVLLSNIDNMKKELFSRGTIYCAMTVYDDLYRYDGKSVYQHSKDSNEIGGHAIVIIGYCNEHVDYRTHIKDLNKGYWICKNSWGTNWPVNGSKEESGYFLIRMGINECGIESRVGTAEVDMGIIDHKIKKYMRFQDFGNFKDIKNNLYV